MSLEDSIEFYVANLPEDVVEECRERALIISSIEEAVEYETFFVDLLIKKYRMVLREKYWGGRVP